jgi:hypothetical protein
MSPFLLIFGFAFGAYMAVIRNKRASAKARKRKMTTSRRD